MKTKTWIEMRERNTTTFMLTLFDFDQGDESCALGASLSIQRWCKGKWMRNFDEEDDPMWLYHMGQTHFPKRATPF